MTESQEVAVTILKAEAPAGHDGPKRLQLSRRIGFDLQRLSQSINGLPAVNCARPTKWGNRHKIGSIAITVDARGVKTRRELTAEDCFHMHRQDLEAMRPQDRAKRLAPLRGKNGSCWCPPDSRFCHVDTLIAFANDIPIEEVRRATLGTAYKNRTE
jgi:hypothetical protein